MPFFDTLKPSERTKKPYDAKKSLEDIFSKNEVLLLAEHHSRKTVFFYLKDNLVALRSLGVSVVYYEEDVKLNNLLEHFYRTGDDSQLVKEYKKREYYQGDDRNIYLLELIKIAASHGIQIKCIDGRSTFFSSTTLGRLSSPFFLNPKQQLGEGNQSMVKNFLKLRKMNEKSVVVIGEGHADMFERYFNEHIDVSRINIFAVKTIAFRPMPSCLLDTFRFDGELDASVVETICYKQRDMRDITNVIMSDLAKTVIFSLFVVLVLYYGSSLLQENIGNKSLPRPR